MVEPDSAEPIWKPPRSVSRSGGVPGVVELGDVGGDGRIIKRAPVETPVAAVATHRSALTPAAPASGRATRPITRFG